MTIRPFNEQDFYAILDLFYQTVHTVNAQDYTSEQLDAWAPRDPDEQTWMNRLQTTRTSVVVEHKRVIGFGTFIVSGIVETLYVSKDFQRKGVGRLLLQEMLTCANRLKLSQVFTEASITARPFFEAQGFHMLEEQRKPYNGSVFVNYIMKKKLRMELPK